MQEVRQAARASRSLALAVSVLCLAGFGGSPAYAQVGASVSLFNDLRLRGYSLSDGRPVGILDLSFDGPTGFYGAVSGSAAATRDEGLKPLGLILNGGFATRVSPHMSLDFGVTHSSYSKYSDRAASLSYTEAYAGISGKLVSARVSLSPDYVAGGSAYGELNGSWPIGKALSLTGHAGLLLPFRKEHPGYIYAEDFDWRIGIAKIIGPVSLQAAWSAVRPGHGVYRERDHARDALIVGLTYSL